MKNYIMPVPWTRCNDQLDQRIPTVTISQPVGHPIIEGNPNDIDTRFQAEFFSKIALDIVTETVYDYPYPYISEKTLRPIACKRFFIVVGPAGVLTLLRSKGFETFGDVIDESYDLAHDPWERWQILESSIKDFVTRPLGEIKQILRDHQDILDHNFETLKSLEDIEISQCLELKP